MGDFVIGFGAAIILIVICFCIKYAVDDVKEGLEREMKYTADKVVSEKIKAICIWQIPGLGDYIKERVDDYLVEKEEEHEQEP